MWSSFNIKRAWKHPTSIETAYFNNILLCLGESHLENDTTWIAICVPAFRRNVLPPVTDYWGNGFFWNVGTHVRVCTTSHRRCYCHHSEKNNTSQLRIYTNDIPSWTHANRSLSVDRMPSTDFQYQCHKPTTACEVFVIWLVNRVCWVSMLPTRRHVMEDGNIISTAATACSLATLTAGCCF